jgi:hypothetical protein
MAIHKDMFDNKATEVKDTLHRIYVEWPGGYFVTSLHNSEFHQNLQEMVADMGPPTKVEFRATDEGWYEEDPAEEQDA